MLFTCMTCMMSFNEPAQLIEHVESIHNLKSTKKKNRKKNKKKIPKVEEKSLKTAKDLRHRLPCDQCPMVFSRIQLLKAHKKNIHSKANKCKFCSTRFPTQENLSEHLISSHMYIRVYYCNLCAQHVPTRADLAYHKARVHEKKSNLVRRMDFDNETEDEGLTDEDIVSDSENEEHKPPSKFSNPPKFMTPLALIPRSKFNWQHSNQKSHTQKKKKRLGKQKRNSNVFF